VNFVPAPNRNRRFGTRRDLRQIDVADGFRDQRQSISVGFRLFVRMLVVKTVTKHVLFAARFQRALCQFSHVFFVSNIFYKGRRFTLLGTFIPGLE
jgi:hypothetical protein